MRDKSLKITRATRTSLYSIAVMTKRYFPYTQLDLEKIRERMECGGYCYLAALWQGHTVGYVDFEVKEGYAQVLGLAVLEEFRNKGIGTKLLQKTISAARAEFKRRGIKLERIDLMVLEENAAARRLYEKIGFERKGILDRELYGKRVLVYSKPLSESKPLSSTPAE